MNKIITESDLPAICLAVEYYPESHHPEGYRQMIRVMWHKYSYIKTVISFDPVHYARIKDFYPGASIFTPEEYLFKLIKDDNMVSLWRMLEVSNINTNGRVAHTSIKGQINFENIFLLLGYALRERLIKKPFQVVCEISPMILWPFLMNGTEMIKTWTRCLRSEKGSQILLKEMSKKINRKNETY